MPRRFFKRYMPNPEKIRANKSLRFLGTLMHDPNLWHLNRHSVSRSMAIGIFWAMIPMPMQMVAAALSAILIRGNLPISIGLVWLTNPITMPPVFYFTYKFGAWLTNTPTLHIPEHVTLHWVGQVLQTHWQPLYIGSFALGLILAVIAYVGTNAYWHWWVRRNWRRRQESRTQKND